MFRRTAIVLTLLILISVFVTVYTFSAHFVALSVHEFEGALFWPTPGYTFLLWPTIPSGIVSQIIVPLNQEDLQYYRYIIRSGILIALTFLFWAIVFWKAWRLRNTRKAKMIS